jgi:cobalamin-dependent methionine synthase I
VPPEPAAPKEVSEESDAESEASVESAPKEKKEKKAKKTEEEKEAEKVAKKEAAALKKAQDKESKEAAKKEAAALKKAEEVAAPKAVEAPKPKPVAMKLKKTAPKVEELPFDIEADGMAHEWVLQGKKVYTDSEGNMWERTDSNEAGPWMGKYDPATKVLDRSAEEPEQDEE